MPYRDLQDDPCSIARPVSLLGNRWTLIMLRQAFRGVRRFEEFQSTLGISRPLLAERLAQLTDAGILERRPYESEQRTRQEYRLTQKGLDLYPVLMALRAWGDRYMAPDGPFAVYRHRDCGGVAEIHHSCGTCGQDLSARDVAPEAGPGVRAGATS
ncbi:MAG: winged helix-turn-helix transcriptional regulator [Streptosporangiaceae bacterium]